MNTLLRTLAVVALLTWQAAAIVAAEPAIPPDAQKEIDEGQAALGKNNWAAAVEHYRKAADIAPRNLEVQEAFILFHRAGNLRTLKREEADARYHELRRKYERMAAREPKNSFWQILIGDVTFYEDPAASRRAFERAVQLDPSEPHALETLGVLAETRGENDLARQYFLKAGQAAPDDPKYLGGYAGNLMDSDFSQFRTEATKIVERFPNSGEAVKWLYWIGSKAPTPEERRQVWQKAIEQYPIESVRDEQAGWLSAIHRAMFESLQKDDPIAAEEFARNTLRRVKDKDDQHQWFVNYRRQSELNVARGARQAGQHDAALEILEGLMKSSTTRDSLKTTIQYEKALNQAATGKSSEALETLTDVLKSEPNAVAEAAFYDIAAKSGKTTKEADDLLWRIRMKDAKPFKDFRLRDAQGKPVSLSDYRGQVVLVNFWYPSCGPCRGEFPHLKKLAERFKRKPFAILALNTHPQENDKVVPFMRGNGYPFRAVQTPDEDWAEKEYSVVGTPANFLIDQEGRIVAQPRIYDDETEARTATQIGQLLERTNRDQSMNTKGGSQ